MKINKQVKVNAPADKVWNTFAHEFDHAHRWMASVPNSYGVDHGERFDGACSAGRTCDLDAKPEGLKAVERFLDYDEARKTATIRVDFANTPGMFPVNHNTVQVSMADNDDGTSTMTWKFQSHIKPWAFVMWPAVRKGFDVFVGQIMDELKFFVENDAPHPRKLKALAKAKAKGERPAHA